MRAASTVTLLALSFPLALAQAGEANLSELALGKTILGPPVTPESLSGKVLMVEFWGGHCATSLSGLPGLTAFERKLRQEGRPFVLVGVECDGVPIDEAIRICKEHGVEFSITRTWEYPEPFKETPFAIVWDHTGKQIYKGSPAGAEEAVEKALPAAPGPGMKSLYLGEKRIHLGEGRYEKLKRIATQIREKSGLGQAAATLRKKTSSNDLEEKSEAQALLSVLERYARIETAAAEAYRDIDPDRMLSELKALGKEFSGDALGDVALARANQLAADPALKRLSEGMKKVAAQERLLETLTPCTSCKDKAMKTGRLSCTACKQANDANLPRIKKALEDIAQRYGGTAAASKAQELAGLLTRMPGE